MVEAGSELDSGGDGRRSYADEGEGEGAQEVRWHKNGINFLSNVYRNPSGKTLLTCG